MKIHRFYVGEELELKQHFWLHEEHLLHQWRNVLRFQTGQEVVLFDGVRVERLYRIENINEREVELKLITEYARTVPKAQTYLLWSLLKKDKNDWVLQKAAELGIGHLLPLLAERSEKTGFDAERAKKIVIEASEQCGRSDIPSVREPMLLKTALEELKGKVGLYVGEQGGAPFVAEDGQTQGILIGPEGGWSDAELALLQTYNITHISMSQFTLRAETAAVIAAQILQG